MEDVENPSEQLFMVDNDLYDAEIDSGTEANEEEDGVDVVKNYGLNGDSEGEESVEEPFDSDNEESLEAIKKQAKKKAKKIKTTLDVTTSSVREPKKRKAKKENVTNLHSETQRLVRESRVKLPYHQPGTRNITHFLKKVPINNVSRSEMPTKTARDGETTLQPEKENIIPQDMATGDETPNETVHENPKLTVANDSFFLDKSSCEKPTGLDHLMKRFYKHNRSKLKQDKPVEEDVKKQADVVEITDKVEESKTTEVEAESLKNKKIARPVFKPGDDLRSLKEKLQANMKLQRAEVRKIHESVRKIDNEEISDEEEEEEEYESEDSDFEMEEWNAADEKAQEEQSLEEQENKKNHEINDDQFDKEESNSIAASDTNYGDFKSQPKPVRKHQIFTDDQTMDLFPSDHSNQTADRVLDEELSEHGSVSSEESMKLRLDSLEDTQDCLNDDQTSKFTKLKTSISELSSDASNVPNGQVERYEINNRSSENLDRSSSNDGLTPFSRIQRLLGVESSSSTKKDQRPKPISELTLPIEDSQDLYGEDDDGRLGLNTSKDFNFALDEDTQFTQFVDTQGFLLSTGKKKKKKDLVNDKSNMSELLGLCSGTFSDKPKTNVTTESQEQMSELLGLCSGKFSETARDKSSEESQENMNELIGLCSGKFTDEKKENPECESQNMSELLGLCSGKFDDENPEITTTSESQNMNELLDLCSGKFTDKKKEFLSEERGSLTFESSSNISAQSESTRKDQKIMNELLRSCSGHFSNIARTEDSGNDQTRDGKKGVFSELDKNDEKPSKSKQGLSAMFENMADDEDNMNDAVALCSGKFPNTPQSKDGKNEEENLESDLEMEDSCIAEDSDVEENSENSDNDVFSDDEKQVDSDDEMAGGYEMKKIRKYGATYDKKAHPVFNKDNFVDEEAELSGSDASSDEEEESGDDELEEDSDCEDLPSDEELQRQVNKVHLKSVIDEDKRELRELKERYLEDGDLYSEGGGRARNFKWQGLEDSQHDMFDNKVLWGDDEIVDNEILPQAELERRKMRHEKDQFFQEQLARTKSNSQPTEVDENSQTILGMINDRSNMGDEEQTQEPEKPVLKRQDSTSTKMSQKRGSFLKRNKVQMSRLSSITTTTTKKTPNSTRGFVFHTISPSSKSKDSSGQKLQRSESLSEPPNPKRPRLDKTMSDIATGSLFADMPV